MTSTRTASLIDHVRVELLSLPPKIVPSSGSASGKITSNSKLSDLNQVRRSPPPVPQLAVLQDDGY
jgi:hypothetical protein